MAAETLNCPMCGASASSDSSKCEHCGAQLATISCPSCFGMMFLGAKYCSHCGAAADRTTLSPDDGLKCPRCRGDMADIQLGKARVSECPKCEGIWASAETVRQICIDQEQQAAVLGTPVSIAPGAVEPEAAIHYIKCPKCGELMNRVNFARCSGVIVDVCRGDGVWFDRDELHRIVDFIRAGGFAKERSLEMADLQDARNRAELINAGTLPGSLFDTHSLFKEEAIRWGLWSLLDMLR